MMKTSFAQATTFSLPATWDGSSVDARIFASVTIHCTVAPSVAPTIQTSPDGNTWATQSAVFGDFSTVTTVANVGRYDLGGGVYVRLNGGTGGTYLIAGGQ